MSPRPDATDVSGGATARLSPDAAFAIRRCTSADAGPVSALAARLFTQAYGPTHPEPELSRYLARSFNPDLFASMIADPTVRVLVVEAGDGTPFGYAHMRATIGERLEGVTGRQPVEIVRFYVDAAWHGRGVAQALMAACEGEARGMGGDVLWLDVWQEAPRPRAFYQRAGFMIVGTTTFDFGERRDADFVMAKSLLPNVIS